jgi:hypothetical protein
MSGFFESRVDLFHAVAVHPLTRSFSTGVIPIFTMVRFIFYACEFKPKHAHWQRADIKCSMAHVVISAAPEIEPCKEGAKFQFSRSLMASMPSITKQPITNTAMTIASSACSRNTFVRASVHLVSSQPQGFLELSDSFSAPVFAPLLHVTQVANADAHFHRYRPQR